MPDYVIEYLYLYLYRYRYIEIYVGSNCILLLRKRLYNRKEITVIIDIIVYWKIMRGNVKLLGVERV